MNGPIVHKGRGAVSNPAGRFERLARSAVDDGWAPVFRAEVPASTGSADDELPASIATNRAEQKTSRAISYNQSPDIFFDRAVNPYRGCEHGCIYCYARPGHAYEGLSPGLDFETRIISRPGLPAQLSRELDARAYDCQPITIGSFTDPYQPLERTQKITRAVIEILTARRHPFSIITKSSLIERDMDLLAPAAQEGLVGCFISVTTLDRALARHWEPRASAPHRRIETIRRLAASGVPVGVMVAPLVPFINDSDLERILEQASQAGARSAHYTVLRLPHEVKGIFQDWLAVHYPERAGRVLRRIQELRGGRLNDPDFHSRMRGQGPWAELIANRFRVAARRFGLQTSRPVLVTNRFTRQGGQGQLGLF